MPTPNTPHAEAALAREAAGLLLGHPLALQLSACSVDRLADIASRSTPHVSEVEISWLAAAMETALAMEIIMSREARL